MAPYMFLGILASSLYYFIFCLQAPRTSSFCLLLTPGRWGPACLPTVVALNKLRACLRAVCLATKIHWLLRRGSKDLWSDVYMQIWWGRNVRTVCVCNMHLCDSFFNTVLHQWSCFHTYGCSGRGVLALSSLAYCTRATVDWHFFYIVRQGLLALPWLAYIIQKTKHRPAFCIASWPGL